MLCQSLMGKELCSEIFCPLIMRFYLWAKWNRSIKRKMVLSYNRSFLNCSFIECSYYLWVKWDSTLLRAFSSTFLICFLQDIQHVDFTFLCFSGKFWSFECSISSLLLLLCIAICTTVRKCFDVLSVVALLIESKKLFSHLAK